jgi:tRNA dimethylallyltransferase
MKLLVILGPSGVGKTELSIELAEELAGEIVSADSRLFYRGMDIGTAKPTFEERQGILHHLVDVADPDESWDLARFIDAAFRAINGITERQKLPILVGGSGQYIRAIVESWSPSSGEPDHQYRDELQKFSAREGSKALHDRLQRVDPARAAQLDHRNIRRVIRALEIHQQTGKPASARQLKQSVTFDSFQLGLTMPRTQLYKKVDRRIDLMLEHGLIDEVQRLIENGYDCALSSMSAIGYAQICKHLNGEMSLDDAVADMRRKTRQLIRQQHNWFKAEDKRICWLEVDSLVRDRAVTEIRAWLRD